MKKIKEIIILLLTKPALFLERLSIYFGWFRYLLFKSPIKRCLKGVCFEFDFSLGPYIKDMYFGWYEPDVINFMESVLKPGDTFIDIGANIGYITARAASLVGKTGEVHSFEPAPPYFQRLEKLSKMNQGYKIVLNQYALGEEEKEVNLIINKKNIGNNYITSDNTSTDSIKVSMVRFDKYVKELINKRIKLIKIDVEVYEFFVLKGFLNYFENTSVRPIIICEIFLKYYPRNGVTIIEFLEYMKQYGYKVYNISHPQEEIDITKSTKELSGSIIFRSS